MSWRPAPAPLRTHFAGDVDPEAPHPEYPRPQLVRAEWLNLNGLWDYATTPWKGGRPSRFQGKILVPFPIESSLSGVGRPLPAGHRLWYRRSLRVPEAWRGQRLLLHFGAVDWEARVFWNGVRLGTHRGGYLPFSFEVTDLADFEGENELCVAVSDPTSRGRQQKGKQASRPRLVFYTAVSGIWQTVWLEPVPRCFVRKLKLTPELDEQQLRVEAEVESDTKDGFQLVAVARDGEQEVGRAEAKAGEPLRVPIPEPRVWSPDDPHLYDLDIRLERAGETQDRIESYFGMRSFDVRRDDRGQPRLHLNGEPVFQLGPLDQGYWPDGLYTAPTDEALRSDVALCKRLGFNTVRKHVKVELARWYHHCDRLGLIVWQDMPNGGRIGAGFALAMLLGQLGLRIRDDRWLSRFGRGSEGNRRQFRHELKEMVEHLASVPCLGGWVPFNEGWGQFESRQVAELLEQLDPTRPVDAASGWFDQGAGDVHSVHKYVGPTMPDPEPERALSLSEYGGLGLRVDGHCWPARRHFVYRKTLSRQELEDEYLKRLGHLGPLKERGLCQAIYTQLTDVEIEINGLATYDRKVVKVDAERLAAAHRRLISGEEPEGSGSD